MEIILFFIAGFVLFYAYYYLYSVLPKKDKENYPALLYDMQLAIDRNDVFEVNRIGCKLINNSCLTKMDLDEIEVRIKAKMGNLWELKEFKNKVLNKRLHWRKRE